MLVWIMVVFACFLVLVPGSSMARGFLEIDLLPADRGTMDSIESILMPSPGFEYGDRVSRCAEEENGRSSEGEVVEA